jgi:DNA repair protein RecO (recombination protein O)
MPALFKTRGIVLHSVKFSETSLIVKIYTEVFGLQSYLFRGVRKKKHSVSPALLQHLSLLEMEVYHKETVEIQSVKEIHAAYSFIELPFNISKSSIALFINEVIYKSLMVGEPDKVLFEFLFTSIQMLDISSGKINDFHLWFCLNLTKYLGFYPKDDQGSGKAFFDLKEGYFTDRIPDHPYFLDKSMTKLFRLLMNTHFENLKDFRVTPDQRRLLIHEILQYFKLHIQGFREIQSHHILEKVLDT